MTRLRRKSAVWALAVLVSLPSILSAQKEQKDQQPKFHVQVNLVSLDVEVLDRGDEPVLGLTKQDFTVKENSKPMEISNFAWLGDHPVSLAMVLDTSSISSDMLVTCKRFIRQLASSLAASDDLCLFSFDSRDAYLEMDFTPDRWRLTDALDNIGVPFHSVPVLGPGGILAEVLGKDPPTGLAIDMALSKLRKTNNGKKALLVISNRFRGLGPATVEHLQNSNCTLMTLGFNNKAAVLVSLGGDKISRNQLMKQSGGRQFSGETGDMAGVCRKIAYSLKNYYAVGYLTEIDPAEKKPRRIEVLIPGKNYTLNFRRSYVPQEVR